MTRGFVCVLLVLVLAGAALADDTTLLSKRYQFQADVILEVRAAGPEGLRLDAVQFRMPATVGGRLARTAGPLVARVELSNTGTSARRAGVALALFDDAGQLLGVGSGSASIKAGRQRTVDVAFDGVSSGAPGATVFQISLEAR
jgi:hypothetical protein